MEWRERAAAAHRFEVIMGRQERAAADRLTIRPKGLTISLEGIKLTSNNILVRLETPGMRGGIVIPENANHDPVGEVLAVGVEYGKRAMGLPSVEPPSVGDRVLFDPLGARRINMSGETLLMLSEPLIFAILPPLTGEVPLVDPTVTPDPDVEEVQ